MCLDAPGVGSERHRAAPSSVSSIADDLLARWQPLRRPGVPCSLCGISLGGMLALDLAHRSGADACVLINSSSRLSPFYERLRPRAALALLRSAFGRAEDAERRMLPFVVNDKKKAQSALAAWTALARERPLPLRSLLQQLRAASSFQPPARLSVPLLLLCSKEDKLVSPKCSYALAQRYGAELRCHPTAGHDLPTDDGEWAARQIAEWHARATTK